MTPEEKAVVEAAIAERNSLWNLFATGENSPLIAAIDALIYSCPECNAGGHTCPGDGNPIGHTAADCGEHDQINEADLIPAAKWIETTMGHCLINDRIRIGSEEATVLRSNRGVWNVDARNEWRPKAWQHVELRLELDVVPGFKQYPEHASIDLLCTPERLAVLRIQEGLGTVEVIDE